MNEDHSTSTREERRGRGRFFSRKERDVFLWDRKTNPFLTGERTH